MNLTLALLLLGASGSAERRLDVAGESIVSIIGQVAKGAVEDVSQSKLQKLDTSVFRLGELVQEEKPRLWIDGRPRTGTFAWLAAANRVASYVLDRDRSGSIEYSYSIRVRGMYVHRRTRIVDASILLTTTTAWVEHVPITKRLTREVPINVKLTIAATEKAGGTRIRGIVSGTASVSDFRCRVVRGFAEAQAEDSLADGLPDALRAIETGGRAYYAAGASDVLDALRAAIMIGRRVRRLQG